MGTRIKFLIESINQAVQPLRDEIIMSYEELYCPVDMLKDHQEILDQQRDQVPLWQLLDMASCICIDGAKDADD